MMLKRYADEETRAFIEEQFAECTTFEEVAFLYSDFERIISELMRAKHGDLVDGIQENLRFSKGEGYEIFDLESDI